MFLLLFEIWMLYTASTLGFNSSRIFLYTYTYLVHYIVMVQYGSAMHLGPHPSMISLKISTKFTLFVNRTVVCQRDGCEDFYLMYSE